MSGAVSDPQQVGKAPYLLKGFGCAALQLEWTLGSPQLLPQWV